MLKTVNVPNAQVINNWGNLNAPIIVENTPRSVPLSVFIRYPVEQMYDRIVSIKAGIQGSELIQSIQKLSNNIAVLDDYIAQLYSKRSINRVLQAHIESIKKERGITTMLPEFDTEDAKSIAKQYLDPILEFLTRVKETSTDIANDLVRAFTSIKDFKEGKYSDNYLDYICILLYKITALEQIPSSKPGVLNDISFYMKFLKDPSIIQESMITRQWFGNTNSISQLLIEKIGPSLNYEDSQFLFDFFIKYLSSKIAANDFIFPEMQWVYNCAWVFFLRFYSSQRQNELIAINSESQGRKSKKPTKPSYKPFSEQVCELTTRLGQNYPVLPLVFEFTCETLFNLNTNETQFKGKPSAEPISLPSMELRNLLVDARNNFRDLSHLISTVISAEDTKKETDQSVQFGKQFINFLPRVMHQCAITMNAVRQLISVTLVHAPPESEETKGMTPYERSMRLGLKEHLPIILQALNVCRSTKELIQTNLPNLMEHIGRYIESDVQNFVNGTMFQAIQKNSNNKKDDPTIPLTALRFLAGLNKQEFGQQEKKSKNQKATIEVPDCPPRLDILELIRTQLQIIINANSSKKPVINEADLKEFQSFVKRSRYYIDLLQLADTIDAVFDQSNLYFKECFLETYKVSFFPVTISLPVILSEFALQNNQSPELAGSIFYPLSIYDDAASKSLRFLKSKMLYEEIKAEAQICLMSITRKIADSTFHPLRKYITLRTTSSTLRSEASNLIDKALIYDTASAARMGVIVQQNQLFLMGCQVDTKSLIAERIYQIFRDEVSKILKLTEEYGALPSIAITKLLDQMKTTHSLFLDFGLPLLPFDDIVSNLFQTDTPNSLQSLYLVNIATHLNTKVLKDFYLITNPNRLIPSEDPKIDLSLIFTGPFGQVSQAFLSPTMHFISVETFRELFWMLDDGAIHILHDQLLGTLSELYIEFANTYNSVANTLVRIKDAPMSMSSYQAFDRFEGAYRYFIEDKALKHLFTLMGQIGNVFAISEMFDNAFALKHASSQQVMAFVLGNSPIQQKATKTEIFELFDKDFQETKAYFGSLDSIPAETEVNEPLLTKALEQFYSLLRNSSELFSEKSTNILNITSLNGIAARWSVLEFLFCLIESTKQGELGSIQMYGEGVMLCAAAILCLENQRSLYRAISIGEKLSTQVKADIAVMTEPRVQNFILTYDFVKSSLECAFSTFLPCVEYIRRNEPKDE